MRVFHVLTLGGALVGLYFCLSELRAASSTDPRFAGALSASALLSATLIVFVCRLRRAERHCRTELMTTVLDVAKYPVLASVEREVARFIGPYRAVHFHCLLQQRTAPAQIVTSRAGVHVLLGFEMLIPGQDPSLVAAIICHEFGHCLQWDTSLGRWTLRATQILARLTFVTCGVALLVVCAVLAQAIIARGVGVVTSEVQVLLGGMALGLAFLFLCFLGGRFWLRFSEYNSDATAAVAGFGRTLSAYLGATRRPHPIVQMMAMHPSPRMRQRMLTKLLAVDPTTAEVLNADSLKIGVSDYIVGTAMYAAPIVFGFQLAAIALANMLRRLA